MSGGQEGSRLAGFKREVTLVGCGRMGFALLSRWIAAGLDPGLVQVVEPAPSGELSEFASCHRLMVREEVEVIGSGLVVLATKPQTLPDIAHRAAGLLSPGSPMLSIMAGVPIARIRSLFLEAGPIIRAMPNLAATVGRSATVLVAEHGSAASIVGSATALLAVLGHVENLDSEDLMDSATALSGSGPGYIFYMVECLAEAGRRVGLPDAAALRLARRTVEGAGAVLSASAKSVQALRDEVTSPGGTTQAGLAVMAEDGRLANLIGEAVSAAAARSRELGI